MFRSIGFVIMLYAISVMLHDAFYAFEDAAAATFKTIESAAQVSEQIIIEQS